MIQPYVRIRKATYIACWVVCELNSWCLNMRKDAKPTIWLTFTLWHWMLVGYWSLDTFVHISMTWLEVWIHFHKSIVVIIDTRCFVLVYIYFNYRQKSIDLTRTIQACLIFFFSYLWKFRPYLESLMIVDGAMDMLTIWSVFLSSHPK